MMCKKLIQKGPEQASISQVLTVRLCWGIKSINAVFYFYLFMSFIHFLCYFILFDLITLLSFF